MKQMAFERYGERVLACLRSEDARLSCDLEQAAMPQSWRPAMPIVHSDL
jgi:hypothetical protein